MAEPTVRYIVRFTGRVQGVGFRATTLAAAQGLDVHGFVRNERDGSVKMDADGSQHVLKELLSRIKVAMSGRIDDIVIDQQPTQNRSDGFHIRG